MQNIPARFTLLLAVSCCSTLIATAQMPAQNNVDLEKQRASIQKEIEDVKHSLDQTNNNRKQTLGQLALLRKRLRLREAAVSNINQQLNLIQADMNNSWQEIIKLKKELDTLRKQYAESVVYAYENRTNYDYLNFLFASGNFNDAVKRVEYLKSYRTYREERAVNIQKTQIILQNKMDGLKAKRVEKDDALGKQNKEKESLESEKKEKDQAVMQLQGREKELKREMNAKQKQDMKLSNAIAAAIRRAREEVIREAKKKTVDDAKTNSLSVIPEKDKTAKNVPINKSNVKPFTTTPDIILSGNFLKDKGHLPWPVSSGIISMQFGPHEYGKGIIHDNKGITIECPAGTLVNSVFNGEVQSVFFVSDVTVVMIRHGTYFTTYSNLSSAAVTKGQSVKMGQTIGKVADIGQLDFLISDLKAQAYDPEKWLRK
jgi:murein hydrolase activator